ncbi:unnamed protein product [Dibothriocephalus latus]|uniref:Cadherin-like beta sandwich domain-containing protein n=1 Tax=Dibothriocephalus latus TaxID=60516 RepID=A0A3P6QBU2_DIBLA|nr:unnamed protein product [Dibothriocephalus latus]
MTHLLKLLVVILDIFALVLSKANEQTIYRPPGTLLMNEKVDIDFIAESIDPSIDYTIDKQQSEILLNGPMGNGTVVINLKGTENDSQKTFTLKILPGNESSGTSAALITQLWSSTALFGFTMLLLNY